MTDQSHAETPNPPPSGDIGELVERLRRVAELGPRALDGQCSEAATALQSQAARIAELEADIEEGAYRYGTTLATFEKRADTAEARLKDAVKVIEEIASIPNGDDPGGLGIQRNAMLAAARAFLSTTGGDSQ